MIKEEATDAITHLLSNPKISQHSIKEFFQEFSKFDKTTLYWLDLVLVKNNKELNNLLYSHVKKYIAENSNAVSKMIEERKFWSLLHWAIAFQQSLEEIRNVYDANPKLINTYRTDSIECETVYKYDSYGRLDKPAPISSDIQITPLTLAAYIGSNNVIDFLIKNASLKELSEPIELEVRFDMFPPLNIAAKKGFIEIVKKLLAQNSQNIKNGCVDLLYTAAEYGYVSIMELALKYMPTYKFSAVNPVKWALNIAAKNGHIEAVKLLLRHGTPIDSVLRYQNPFVLAATNGHSCILELLFAHYNQNVDDSNYIHNFFRAIAYATPLYYAAKYGHKACVEILLQIYNAGPNIGKDLGKTPLYACLYNSHSDCLRILMECGVDVYSNIDTGISISKLPPLIGNTQEFNNHKRKITEQLHFSKKLTFGTPLFFSVVYADIKCVQLLLTKQDQEHVNQKLENSVLIQSQIKTIFYSADEIKPIFNISEDCQGITPLFAAIKKGYVDKVQILLEHGASVIKPFFDDQLPIHIALNGKDEEIVAMILYTMDNKSFKIQDFIEKYAENQQRASILIELDKVYNDTLKSNTNNKSLLFYKYCFCNNKYNYDMTKYTNIEALWRWLVYKDDSKLTQPISDAGYEAELSELKPIYQKILNLKIYKYNLAEGEKFLVN